MANIKSKEKNIKRIQKATEKNRAVKSRMRTAIKAAKVSAANNSDNLNETLKLAKKEIAKAVKHGVIHKNNGARKASRLDAYVAKKTTK